MIRRLIKKAAYFFRSAITGKFVSREYAEEHPETTVKEKRRG
jgi:hypothetical protein